MARRQVRNQLPRESLAQFAHWLRHLCIDERNDQSPRELENNRLLLSLVERQLRMEEAHLARPTPAARER